MTRQSESHIPHLNQPEDSGYYPVIKDTVSSRPWPSGDLEVQCDLRKPGGYKGQITVSITNGDFFEADRFFPDWTRFPARIRAGATALRDAGETGDFEITHEDGLLTIRRLQGLFVPTSDGQELEAATKELLRRGITRIPVGTKQPVRSSVQQDVFPRSPEVRAWVLQQASGRCEGCCKPAPFMRDDGLPFLEVHHLKMLADGGSDRVTNAVALCPNCHRRCHYSSDRETFTESFYARIPRLVRE